MIKKALILFVIFSLIACHSTQTVVRTTKKVTVAPRKTVTHIPKNNPENTSNNKPRTTETMESTSKTVVYTEVVNDYILKYKDIAMNNMRKNGIPASIILAQGILESGAGKGNLALIANNHFGIKCHENWTGETVNYDDDAAQECFRKYNDPAESYSDHASFLTSRKRYANLFELPKGDYAAWAKGLRADGYATDPKYPDKLITYIERYNLHQYDAQVLGIEFKPIEKKETLIVSTEDQSLYEVQKGDTLYSISKKFNLTVEELMKKNNLSDNALALGQKLKVD
jgi:flagellum-specific peptidoglycan hydrolase FlgJ